MLLDSEIVREPKVPVEVDATSQRCDFGEVGTSANQVSRYSKEIAEVLAATSDPIRLKLLAHYADAYPEPLCACALVASVGRSQSTVSHHLTTLVHAGWLTSERRGRWIWYRLESSRLPLFRAIEDFAANIKGSKES